MQEIRASHQKTTLAHLIFFFLRMFCASSGTLLEKLFNHPQHVTVGNSGNISDVLTEPVMVVMTPYIATVNMCARTWNA